MPLGGVILYSGILHFSSWCKLINWCVNYLCNSPTISAFAMHRRGLYFLAAFWLDGVMSRILANDLRVRVEIIFLSFQRQCLQLPEKDSRAFFPLGMTIAISKVVTWVTEGGQGYWMTLRSRAPWKPVRAMQHEWETLVLTTEILGLFIAAA